jgi:creatinine deaminase
MQRARKGNRAGSKEGFQSVRCWLHDAGISVDCLDDPACEALMQRMLQQKAELWHEDIGR